MPNHLKSLFDKVEGPLSLLHLGEWLFITLVEVMSFLSLHYVEHRFAIIVLAMIGVLSISIVVVMIVRKINIHFKSRYIPLPKLMVKLYETTRGTDISEFAERSSSSSDSILEWYAFWAVEKGLPIYGKKPPSTLYELISKEDCRIFSFNNNVAYLKDYLDNNVKFTELAAMSKDFDNLFSKLVSPP